MEKSISEKPLRANFLAWALETALGSTVFIIIFGKVFYPIFMSTSTAGWDEYSLLLWGFLGMTALAAFMIRVIDSAKRGYQPLF